MNPAQAWAMLNARGVQPGRAFGGTPTLTAADIAHMLNGLDRGPFLMGMAMQTGDLVGVPELEVRLLEEVRSLQFDLRWQVSINQREVFFPRLAALSVFEALNPRPESCSTCHSRGYVNTHTNALPCTDCGQTGGHPLSPNRRAYITGIACSSWREPWSARYEQIHAVACGWHGRALSHLARGLSSLRWRENFTACVEMA